MTPPDDFDPVCEVVETLEPGVRRIVAANPSPMTYRGTNTYLVGTRDIAVIDPGPDMPAHLEAILAAILPDQRISHIVVTHTHLDHSPLARALSDHSDAPIFAFGDALAGRSAIMQDIAKRGLLGGGEGIDHNFRCDQTLKDGDIIEGTDWSLEVIHTPGHLGNHIALGLGRACFTADHVMGWASSLVSPPDGDLTDFMASCKKLRAKDWRVFFPGHGAPIANPHARIDWLIGHRLARESAILAELQDGANTAKGLAQKIYLDTPAPLLDAATRNVLAHLIDLTQKKVIKPVGALGHNAEFELC